MIVLACCHRVLILFEVPRVQGGASVEDLTKGRSLLGRVLVERVKAYVHKATYNEFVERLLFGNDVVQTACLSKKRGRPPPTSIDFVLQGFEALLLVST